MSPDSSTTSRARSLVVDGFRCKQCDGTIQEDDLAEDLVLDGETYGIHSLWIWWS